MLRPTKANFGPLPPPLYLRADFTQGAVSFLETGASDGPLGGVSDDLPKVEQVYQDLCAHPDGISAAALAEAVGMQARSLYNHLTVLRTQNRARPLGDGVWQALRAHS